MTKASSPKTIEQVIAQFVQAAEAGRPMDTARLLSDYPEFADELSEFFRVHSQFIQAAQTTQEASERYSAVSADTAPANQETDGPPSWDSSLASGLPKIFGDYEILEEIDRGGMGIVYQARHRELGRTVALKLIRSGELAREEEVQRFRSEAEAAAALTHPGIVPIYEVGTLHGLVYYTMAYIEGQSLAQVVAGGALDPTEATRIVYKLCAAVEHAHRAGVYHRDLKPANVLLDRQGQPIIIDFGLAKFAHRDSSLTTTGQILGTPAYVAPEHASGRARAIGPASDVYSLGAILYCLCAGQPPFSGPTPFDVLLQVLDRQPPSPSKLNRRVSAELDYVCQRALEKDPADRYKSASELAADLQRILQGEPVDCPRPKLFQQLETWWRREPILVSHVCGIGATMAIVGIFHVLRGQESAPFPFRMLLLLTWFVASFGLQYWVYRDRWRDIACLSWATVDVTLYTTLIAFADPPRSMLLIGYPMMIVASSLFYRKRFVVFMTVLCMAGFLVLGLLAPREDFVKPDFCAIFLCGLIVIGLSLLAIIRRVRGMSFFYEDSA